MTSRKAGLVLVAIAAGFLAGCSAAHDRIAESGNAAPARLVSSPRYAVTVSIPASWQPTPKLGQGRFGYDGTSGWVQLLAATQSAGLRQACVAMATGNDLHPYGLHPHISYRTIAGRPACLILPSSDAPRQAQRAGGHTFQASSALVEYRQPIPMKGYPLLVVNADPAHLVAIANSIRLHH